MKGVLVCASDSHWFHPLLWPGNHHVHIWKRGAEWRAVSTGGRARGCSAGRPPPVARHQRGRGRSRRAPGARPASRPAAPRPLTEEGLLAQLLAQALHDGVAEGDVRDEVSWGRREKPARPQVTPRPGGDGAGRPPAPPERPPPRAPGPARPRPLPVHYIQVEVVGAAVQHAAALGAQRRQVAVEDGRPDPAPRRHSCRPPRACAAARAAGTGGGAGARAPAPPRPTAPAAIFGSSGWRRRLPGGQSLAPAGAARVWRATARHGLGAEG